MNDFADDDKTDPSIVLPTSPPPLPPAFAAQQTRQTETEDSSSETSPVTPGSPIVPPNLRMPEMGLIAPLMKDPEITEIMVNDLRNIMVEKNGQMYSAGIQYTSIDELNRLARNILDITGRILSPDYPYVDTMLPDGSRVNIVAPPLTQHGPCLTIRKFPSRRYNLEDLIQSGMLDKRMAYFLQACTLGKMNIVLSGGTGCGKTTLLNALAGQIPRNERVVTIEDTPELVIPQINSVKLQTKPQMPASPPVPARDLVANSLRMRPDRIILGECRRGEAFDMLQAMNTGHGGSMTTIHANSPRDALARLETLCLLAGADLPLLAIRRQISEAVDLLVHTKRTRDGKRRVTAITEVTGMEGDTITTQDVYLVSGDHGPFKCTGLVPSFVDRLKENGVELPQGFFAQV